MVKNWQQAHLKVKFTFMIFKNSELYYHILIIKNEQDLFLYIIILCSQEVEIKIYINMIYEYKIYNSNINNIDKKYVVLNGIEMDNISHLEEMIINYIYSHQNQKFQL